MHYLPNKLALLICAFWLADPTVAQDETWWQLDDDPNLGNIQMPSSTSPVPPQPAASSSTTREYYSTRPGSSPASSLWDELSFFIGIDGTKQPQEFGVNAHVGGQGSVNWGVPLLADYGIGAQVGTGITATSNAVRVYELLGESTGRRQNYTTVGLFQRCENGFAWGFVHDFLAQDYYDEFALGQWRLRSSYRIGVNHEFGATAMLPSFGDSGVFGASTAVELQPITQGHIYWRQFWETGAQTTTWLGMAEGHGEDNAVTGFSPAKDEQFLFGADVLMPLTNRLAIFGETNMIMPTDTGTVDAFLGIQWYPRGGSSSARRRPFSPLMTLASPVSFAVDLFRQ